MRRGQKGKKKIRIRQRKGFPDKTMMKLAAQVKYELKSNERIIKKVEKEK